MRVRVRPRLAASSTIDQSFDLCVFKDDPAPLDGRIHSARLKSLLREFVHINKNIFLRKRTKTEIVTVTTC